MSAPSCERCGASLPADGRFCPACGLEVRQPRDDPTTAQQLPPHETSAAPASYDVAMPRYFGLTPPMMLFALATAALASAIALAILERWVWAIVLAAISLLLLVLFVGVARRKPDTAFARRSVHMLDRVRQRTGWTLETVSIRSRAGRELSRLRLQLVEQANERDRLLRELGAAVYQGDEQARDALIDRIAQGDADMREKEAEMQAIAHEAQERIQRGRLGVQPTVVEAPESSRAAEPSPPPDEGSPPQPAPVPEPAPPPDEGSPPQPAVVPEPSPPPDEATPPQPATVPEPGPERSS